MLIEIGKKYSKRQNHIRNKDKSQRVQDRIDLDESLINHFESRQGNNQDSKPET